MKRYKNYILGVMTTVAMMLPTSCKDDTFEEYDNGDEVTVSFTLSPEAASIKSRSRANEMPHIGDGSSVDMLIYAVYDENDNLLMGYSAGSKVPGFDHGDGQTIVPVDKFPYTLNLILKRNTKYKIAFWAQSSKTKAYNTSDLRKVELIYSEVDDSALKGDSPEDADEDKPSTGTTTTTPNNDELRDAFCRSITITPSGSGKIENNVYLYRPLAQINVGTEGWDYEIINRHAVKKYRYSKIRINRVARYLDVVNDEVLTSTTSETEGSKTAEAYAVVDFGYSPIPAYYKMWGYKNNQQLKLPEYPSHTIFDWIHNPDYSFVGDLGEAIGKDDYKDIYGDEEFLRVNLYSDSRDAKAADDKFTHLDGDGKYLAYASLNEHEGQQSETFKYLSMCYVLTASKENEPIVLNNVKVWLATDEHGTDSIKVLDIDHVPAQRNWRTNIVGSLLTQEKSYEVKLDNNFAGEFTGKDDDWSGQIAKGVYYNAEEDIIEISDADGLLWFQQMVNGDLRLREDIGRDKNHSSTTDRYITERDYRYYNINSSEDKPIRFTYGNVYDITRSPSGTGSLQQGPVDDKLKKLILKATHQDQNEDGLNGWPVRGNFHFMGKDKEGNISRATVKLMADIDLTGIEWIPIGFDCQLYDGSMKGYFNANDRYAYITGKEYTESNSTGLVNLMFRTRAFCGIFDGNGHSITGLSTFKYGAKVPYGDDKRTDETQLDGNGPYDTFLWFANGLFGMLSGNAEVKNLRLNNVDIFGYHTAGAIAGTVSGDNVNITNCIVDGGKIILSPMFRGDACKVKSTAGITGHDDAESNNARSFARGIYAGGIVGYYNGSGIIENCEVRNLELKAYRNIGGIIGSVSATTTGLNAGIKFQTPSSVSNNKVNNVTIIADKFQVYDNFFNTIIKPNGSDIYKSGFGWNGNQLALSGDIIGGDENTISSINMSGNSPAGVIRTEFSSKAADLFVEQRIAEIENIPLEKLPLLSSWFSDTITLNSNYSGTSSAYRDIHTYKFKAPKINEGTKKWPDESERDYIKSYTTMEVMFPFNLPFNMGVDFDESSPRVGMFVESVMLDGKGGIGGRSVVTPTDVERTGAATMFITSRDRKTMWENSAASPTSTTTSYKQPTKVYNMVLRGAPYAWAGLLISPNDNMDSVILNTVNIYDVYKTISLDKNFKQGNYWTNKEPSAANVHFKAIDCNLRGFTELGNEWKSITFNHTTFEEGTYIREIYSKEPGKQKESYTYKVENDVTFNHCYFKAPFRIEIGEKSPGVPYTVTFDAPDTPYKGKKCQATSTSTTNVDLTNAAIPNGCRLIEITSSPQGDPIVTYYDKDHKAIKL